ncbi:hypothetical protein MOBT1_000181 [Malassezia obtusa]|uniref:Uncharacterized protein n=1 Tax=Malassezia obtusa TaxID=76774 RepID=A0AAF0DXQ6_9BASI|nr:hypothetical protein MOBT1_000181 [Malassezia obtusa]
MERPPLDVRVWSPPLVVEWLQQFELGQYAPQFLENDIDGEALVLLDDESLRDLGVASIGHRMTLLSEIFSLKQAHGIQIEPGDWVPQNYEAPTQEAPPWHAQLQERDERIAALEARVAQLSASLLRLREDVIGLARATDKPDAVQQAALLDTPQGPPSSRALGLIPGHTTSPRATASAPAANATPPPGRPTTRGRGWPDATPPPRRLNTAESLSLSPLRPPVGVAPPVPHVGSLAPIADAVAHMLQASGAEVRVLPSDEPVTIDDTTQMLLALALRKYGVRDAWHEFALLVHSASTERCLTYEEKPLLLLQKLRESGTQPWFVVRHLRDVESPIALAEKKLQLRRRDAGRQSKNEAMRLRAALLDPDEPRASERVVSVSQYRLRAAPDAEQTLQNARILGPAATVPLPSAAAQTYALAIYPYESEREDEFDVRAGDAFIVLAKAKGWWALRRDSLADGHGDVYLPSDLGERRAVEVWTGWVPAGCLLETSRPIADLLFAHTGGALAAATRYARTAATETAPRRTLRQELIHAPLPLAIVLSSGTHGTMLAPFDAPDGTLHLVANERLRVFKRYNHWSYCIVDGPSQARGWVPSWFISRKPSAQEPRTMSAGEVQSRRTKPGGRA